jgi:hypothetical protein
MQKGLSVHPPLEVNASRMNRPCFTEPPDSKHIATLSGTHRKHECFNNRCHLHQTRTKLFFDKKANELSVQPRGTTMPDWIKV